MRNPSAPSPPPPAAAAAAMHSSDPVPRATPPLSAAAWASTFGAAPPSGYAKVPSSQPAAEAAAVPDPTAPPSPVAKVAELVARFKEQGQALIAARRPWGEVLHGPAFSKPASLAEATARMRRNAAYFRANYALVVLAVVASSLFWHPGTLFALLALCAAWFFLYFGRSPGPLRLFGRSFDDGTVLLALTGLTVVALLFTDVGWNVIGSALIGAALVAGHAALRSTDDLFLTEQEAASGGLVFAGPVLPTYVRVG